MILGVVALQFKPDHYILGIAKAPTPAALIAHFRGMVKPETGIALGPLPIDALVEAWTNWSARNAMQPSSLYVVSYHRQMEYVVADANSTYASLKKQGIIPDYDKYFATPAGNTAIRLPLVDVSFILTDFLYATLTDHDEAQFRAYYHKGHNDES